MIFSGMAAAAMFKGYMLAALTVCPVQPPPRVQVMIGASKTYYDETVTSDRLRNSLAKDKDSTFASDEKWIVGGAMTSVIDGNSRVAFKTITDNRGNQCFYVDKVTMIVFYQPAIFIAKNVVKSKCHYDVVRAHEELHVAIDIHTLMEYKERVEIDLLLYLASLGYTGFGPYPVRDVPKHQKELISQINKANEPLLEKLREARRARQGSIDTEENYRREWAKCPEAFPR